MPLFIVILAGSTIFLSAFLLFSVEPLVAKKILPWFGGSAAVWSTCLVYYQTALLVGYLYVRFVTRFIPDQKQAGIHLGLLAVSLLFLPLGPGDRWSNYATSNPPLLILVMLTVSIGAPFVALSATSPLLQHWLAKKGVKTPYQLFALSNLASFTALFAYPSAFEPHFDTRLQSIGWSLLYGLFAVGCGWLAWIFRSASKELKADRGEILYILPTRKASWFSLAACGSMLLLSVTNHIDANVAPVPLLWVLPLAVYLLTFVLAFSGRMTLPPAISLRFLAFALGILGYATYNINSIEAVQISLPVLLLGLFGCCLFCHNELYRFRPDTRDLTSFYLVIAAGGAAGAVFVGLFAPLLFAGIYEFPAALISTALLGLILYWGAGSWSIRVIGVAVLTCMLFVLVETVRAYHENSISLTRSFYGSLRVVQSPRAGPEQIRTLFNGTIEHGAQYFLPPARHRPTTYYGRESGIGILLREGFEHPMQVGVIGLGVGTLAAYGRPGDFFRFYEINTQVTDVAQSLFFYLRESRAHTQIIEGDGRLSLARELGQTFDILVLDAFSGDAIPVHLLTREAFQIYGRHLKKDGVIALHVSNDFLDLAPVVSRLASDAGYFSLLVRSHENTDEAILAADWMLVTTNQSILHNPSISAHTHPISLSTSTPLWTDTYNNLLQILKIPQIR